MEAKERERLLQQAREAMQREMEISNQRLRDMCTYQRQREMEAINQQLMGGSNGGRGNKPGQ